MSARVDLEAMREWAAEIRRLDSASDETTADYMEAAAAELAEHRRGTDEPRGHTRSPVDVPVDLGYLEFCARTLLDSDHALASDVARGIGAHVLAAVTELDLWRHPRIPADTTLLGACRDRASRLVAAGLAAGFIVRTEEMDDDAIVAEIAGHVETMAHCLLAAEREPGK